MRSNTLNYTLTAATAAAVLFFCPALRANATITVSWSNPGGYATATTASNPFGAPSWTTQLVFCLDGNQYYSGGGGTLATTSSTVTATQEEEAAFLAAYAGYLDPSHNDNNSTSTVESDIQTAIWDVMHTLPGVTVTGNALTDYNKAVSEVANNPTLFATGSAFMNTVLVWTPSPFTVNTGTTIVSGNQRFIGVGSLTPQIITTLTSTPEPGTMVFLGTGVLLMALSRIRRRK
jgi:hypothetical protein